MFEKLKKIDWSVFLILLLFLVISSLLVHSATVDDPRFKTSLVPKNAIIFGLGMVVFLFISLIDYRLLIKTSVFSYIIGIVLLLALYQWGVERYSARGWFELPFGGLDFQPAELMKLILIITITFYLGKRDGERLQLVRDVLPIGLIVFLPFVLVLMQPDLGNAVIYLIILLGMYWIGNIKYIHVLIGMAIIVAGLILFFYLFQHFHEPIKNYLDAHHKGHWVGRIDTYINPETASEKDKYQVMQSIRAIGSGSLMGDGYLKGIAIHKASVPVAYSDAIFVVVGEEFGFVGASLLLLLYFVLIYRMILISIQAFDLSGSYLIVGIVSMYVFQIFENVGMLIGLMPLTGITLPFVSYGGTSQLINMASLGLVMSVRVHQEKPSMYRE